jgi:hypothetical protein
MTGITFVVGSTTRVKRFLAGQQASSGEALKLPIVNWY